MKTFPRRLIKDAIDGIEEASIREYSGRGMYGKYCGGIGFEHMSDAFTAFARLGVRVAEEDTDSDVFHDFVSELDSLLRTVATDSMGHGVIVYFPGYTFS